MSLATRCPACGTIFRVVQDQLKVSEGWVRCGQCHEVFHGIEALFDLDSDPAIAARRAASRGSGAPPPTRVFADQRASAPIPMPTPEAPVAAPAPVAIPARPPVSLPGGAAQQSVPATPSAFGAPSRTAPTTGLRPGYTGFTPATRPMPPAPVPPPPAPRPPPLPPPPAPLPPPAPVAAPTPFAPVATRGTIAPRFAARLAEEAARAQAAAPSPIPSAFPPPAAPAQPAAPAPAPFASALAQHTTPSWQAPAESSPAPALAPVPAPAPAFAPAPAPEPLPAFAPSPSFAPVPVPAPAPAPAPIVAVSEQYIPPSIAANRASVFAPTPPAVAPTPAPVAVPVPARAETPLVTPIPTPSSPPPIDAAPSAAQLAASFAAPSPVAPVAEPFAEPEPAAAPAVEIAREPAPEVGGSTMASRLADDAAAEEQRAGPPTLASMLPEDAGDWPPRKTKKRPADATATTSEIALVDRSKDPRFLREARSGARWRKPWVRAVLSVMLLLLIVAAVGQVAWPQRDVLASRWPATLPAWNWLCEQADCKIEAPRAIASLALDGSSLTRTDTEHVLLFSADLHNRSSHAVRMPSFDLTFMDLNGEIVARKVLSPEQIGIQQAALPADGELHVHARLQVGSLPASGFQADLFYP